MMGTSRTSAEIKAEEDIELDALDDAKREGRELAAAAHEQAVTRLQQDRLEALRRERAATDTGGFVSRLGALLGDAKLCWNFDRDRDITKPCIVCDGQDEPRALVVIGTYTRRMGSNIAPGDPIERPMCERCRVATEVAAPVANQCAVSAGGRR